MKQSGHDKKVMDFPVGQDIGGVWPARKFEPAEAEQFANSKNFSGLGHYFEKPNIKDVTVLISTM